MATRAKSRNTQELESFLAGCHVGQTLDIATSEYAYNTTPPGFSFAFHSTAPCVHGLVKRGFLKLRQTGTWRYLAVEVVKIPQAD